jgi:hypothetical protein
MDDHNSKSQRDEDTFAQDVADVGWRLGLLSFEPGIPLALLPARARQRAWTYVRRCSALTAITDPAAPPLSLRRVTRLALEFGEGYVEGALEGALRWAWAHDDAPYADQVRAFFLDWDWPPATGQGWPAALLSPSADHDDVEVSTAWPVPDPAAQSDSVVATSAPASARESHLPDQRSADAASAAAMRACATDSWQILRQARSAVESSRCCLQQTRAHLERNQVATTLSSPG